MEILILTNEYPPNVYGGAGVHVEFLSRELARLEEKSHSVRVLCFGEQRERRVNLAVDGVEAPLPAALQAGRHHRLLDALARNLSMTGLCPQAHVVHGHTWYTHFAGYLIKELHGIPLVLTTHSLEPQRPWKAEQLGSAYKVTEWLERTAYNAADGVIAVSSPMKESLHELYGVPRERIRVIHNGIDLNQYRPAPNREILGSYGIDPDLPLVLFVGRISRQKGIIHLLRSLRHLKAGLQVALFAGLPDTEELGREIGEGVGQARAHSENRILWIPKFVPPDHLATLYSHAAVFVCPSVYEPFGIINLEAMACGAPVVASAVGGIPEVVVHGETGMLVPFEPAGPANPEPRDPERFARDLARSVNGLVFSPETRKAMGARARKRVEQFFSWERIARQTLDFYRELSRQG